MNKKRLVSILLTMLMLSSLTFNFASVWAEGEATSESEQVAENTSNEQEASTQAEAENGENNDASESASSNSQELNKAAVASQESAPARTRSKRAVSQPLDYTFDVKWANGVSSGVVDYHYDDAADPDHKNLIMTPVNRELKVATLAYSLAINNDATTVLPAGAIKITMPNYLFEAWTDKYKVNRIGEYTVDNPVKWQIPKAPATSSVSDFNYVDNGDGTYTVTNFKPIAGGAKLHFEQAFQFRPLYIQVDRDGVQKKDLSFKLEIDSNGDGTPDATTTRDLSAEIHNKTEKITIDLKKDHLSKEGGVYFSWQDVWGPKPSDAKDYFYVVWYADVKRSQTDTIPNNYEIVQDNSDGELIGAKKKDGAYNVPYGFIPKTSLDRNTDTSYSGIAESGWQDNLNQVSLYNEYTGPWASHTMKGLGFADWDHARMLLLKRYPVSILKDAKNNGVDLETTGVPVTNKVTVKTKLANGVEYTDTDTESKVINVKEYSGVNNIWKYDAADRINGRITIPGALDFTLGGDDRELRFRPNLRTFETELEGNPLTEPTFDDDAGDYKAKPYTAEIEEGALYNSTTRDASGNRLKSFRENEASLNKLSDEDATYKSVAITLSSHNGVKSSIGGWTIDTNPDNSQSRSKPIEIWTRKAGESGFTKYGEITFDANGKYTFNSTDGSVTVDDAKGKEIPLPSNTAGLKYKYTSEYFHYKFNAQTVVELHPTNHLKGLLTADKNQYNYSAISTYAKVSFDENGAKKQSTDTKGYPLYVATVLMSTISPNFSDNLEYSMGELVDDPVRGVQTNTIKNRFRQYSSLYDSGLPDREYLNNYVYNKGTLYTLLPIGTSVQKSSVALSGGPYWQQTALTQGAEYQIEMIEDWEGSGQTMMKIDYSFPPEKANVKTYSNHDFTLNLIYKLDNPYSNIIDRGNSVTTTTMLNFDPDGKDVVRKPLETVQNEYNRLVEKSKFDNLTNGDLNNWRMLSKPIQYNPVTVTQSGLTKEVANNIDNSFSGSSDTYIGNGYSYRIAYTASNYTRSDKLVFYDVLDNGSEDAATEWKGTFERIDVRSIDTKLAYGIPGETAKPVVYYATTVPSELNVDDSSVWSTTMPADKSSIKAIAVDVRKTDGGHDFILDHGNSLSFYIYMKAPKDKSLDKKKAVNEVISNARNFTGEQAGAGDQVLKYKAHSEITLHVPDLQLNKESTPASGTEEAPAVIANEKDTELTYRLKIKNNDTVLAARDINVEDVIPEGLEVNKDDIRITSAALNLNNVPLSSATGVGLTQDGQKLSFSVALPKDAEMTITIPTKLKDKTIKTTVLKNTAKITKAEDIDLDVKSNTTYHKTIRTYELNYVVNPDPNYGAPADSTTPAAVTEIEYDTNQNLVPALTTTKKVNDDGLQGIWSFDGWKKAVTDNSTVSSVNIRGNTTVYGTWKFTPTRDLSVTKKWVNYKGENDPAPVNKVKIELLQNGVVKETKEVNASDNWTYTFKDLEKFNPATGILYTYTVREHGLNAQNKIDYGASRYTASTDGTMDQGYTITNKKSMPWVSMIPATTSLTVTKQWEGLSQANIDAQSVKVVLYKNGVATTRNTTLDKNNNFKATFAGLLDADTVGAAKNVYSVRELDANDSVLEEGSTVTINNRTFKVHYDGKKVVNTLVDTKTEVSGKKVWDDANDQDGKRPDEVTVHLHANGADTGKTAKATKASNWEYSFKNLNVYDENGDAITYTVTEDQVEGYEAPVINGTTITNKRVPDTLDIPVEKIWDDNENESHMRPDKIHVYLYADEVLIKEQELSEANAWKHVFEDMPKYSAGKEIKYRLSEPPANNYNVKITGDAQAGFKVTNSYYVFATTDTVSVKKVLDGNPLINANFSFRLEAENVNNPMPDGSDNGSKLIQINGAGETDFGEIEFEEKGIYKYYITEINSGEKNYTYDAARYTVTFDVRDEQGQLVAYKKIEKEDGTEVEAVSFTNVYKLPEVPKADKPSTPNTFDDSNAMRYIVLLAASMLLIVFIEYRKRSVLADTK